MKKYIIKIFNEIRYLIYYLGFRKVWNKGVNMNNSLPWDLEVLEGKRMIFKAGDAYIVIPLIVFNKYLKSTYSGATPIPE